MKRAYEIAANDCANTLNGGQTGPHCILGRLVTRQKFLRRTCAARLWNEMRRRNKIDKDGMYHRGCLYETLKGRLNV